MSRAIAFALVLSLSFPSGAEAKALEGVQMPDSLSLEGRALQLNGVGLRMKFIFKVYVAGLYLEAPSKNAADVISSEQIKQVRMVMLRDLGKEQVAEAIREGFTKNAGPQMGALKERLDKLTGMLPDLKKGEQLVVTYLPGKGTLLSGAGGEKAVIPGKDFADAMFSVWLGKQPVDENLKKGMLGE